MAIASTVPGIATGSIDAIVSAFAVRHRSGT
jgi:hypothetical protein